MALRASADEASFVGVDGLTLTGKGLLVEINRNLSSSNNTVLGLNLSNTLGTVEFGYNSTTASLTLTPDSTDATVRADLLTALAALDGITADDVLIFGTLADGYTLEFVGDLQGTDVTGLTVTTTAPTITTTVTEQTAAAAGINAV